MKTLTILWKRFKSESPAILVRVQKFLNAISVITGSLAVSLLAFPTTSKFATTCGIIAAVSTALTLGLAGGVKLSTTSTAIQKLSDSETGLPK